MREGVDCEVEVISFVEESPLEPREQEPMKQQQNIAQVSSILGQGFGILNVRLRDRGGSKST